MIAAALGGLLTVVLAVALHRHSRPRHNRPWHTRNPH